MDRVNGRPRLATVWLGGCSGCHMSFLDMDERLIELAGRVQLLASPFADYKEFPEANITLVEGAVASREHLRQIREIRRRSRVLVAFGDCAVTGNVTALRNLFPLEDVIGRAYRETATVVAGIPGGNDAVPALLDRVSPVHEIVKVDHFLPGCPPSADAIYGLLNALLEGVAPAGRTPRFG